MLDGFLTRADDRALFGLAAKAESKDRSGQRCLLSEFVPTFAQCAGQVTRAVKRGNDRHCVSANLIDEKIGQRHHAPFSGAWKSTGMADLGEIAQLIGARYKRAINVLCRLRIIEGDIIDDVAKITGRRIGKNKPHLLPPAMFGGDGGKNLGGGLYLPFLRSLDALLDAGDLPRIGFKILLQSLIHDIVA
ncbi:hypothetical protein RM192_04955 [Novosphingobium sp. MMS21-SN21R]|nr:hypothetical protein [Novosphingobium sp. MMS21-SN21R]MDT0507338.1 hypothetical protein [Novosphingobium sp. MMS21-SN21R]